MNFDKFIHSCNHHYHNRCMKCFHCHQKSFLMHLLSQPHSQQAPCSLPFPECHGNGLIQPFESGFSNVPVAVSAHSLLCRMVFHYKEEPLLLFFFNLVISQWTFGWFPLCGNYEYICFKHYCRSCLFGHDFSFHLDKYLGGGLLGHRVSAFNFWGYCWPIFQTVWTIAHSHGIAREVQLFCVPASQSALGIVSLFCFVFFSYYSKYIVASRYGFNDTQI